MDSYGKLILVEDGNPAQEFELNKASVTLGRAMTNDIVLGDARASRSHARIECSRDGCVLVDLGSSNGTRLNGLPVTRTSLGPGDTLTLGSSTLRFETPGLSELPEMTLMDSLADLEQSIDQEYVPMVLNETSQPRLVVFTAERTWEVPLGAVDEAIIGRALENEVVLAQTKVSRQHARLFRTGDGFALRDLDSTNGTWYRGAKVAELILADGDMVRIGDAQIVYRSGFAPAQLTMVDEALHVLPERTPVVFVPGFMGSELWLGSERVWPNVKTMVTHPEVFAYGPESQLEARGIVDQVVIVPNLIKQDQYNRLGDYMVEDLGYARGRDFFEFAYDWRQDVRQSARQLGAFVESLPVNQPVIIIAHSLGTLVSRYYIEKLGGKDRVRRVILMGGPHYGVPKALTSLLVGADLLPFGFMGEKIRQILVTFPSSYQILPIYPCATDQQGEKINFMQQEDWLPEAQRPFLYAAREFRRELGMASSIPAISIFGYGLKTIAGITFQREGQGLFSNIIFRQEPAGDSTIPQNSAVLDGTEIHPVQQYHGSLFVDQDVKMRLKLELTRLS